MVAGLLLCTAWYYTILSGFFILYCPVMYLMFLSHRLYRKLVDTLFALWELYPVALFQCCCNTELHHFGDYVNADEKTIIVMNHRTRVDWNYVWIALYHAAQNPAQEAVCTCKQTVDSPNDSANVLRIGGKSKIKFVLKDEIKNIPGMANSNIQSDAIQTAIGAWGRYQAWLCFLIFLNKVPMGWMQMAIIFLAPPVTYKCGDELNTCPCENPEYDKSVFESTIITEWDLICDRKSLAASAQMIIQAGTLIGSIIFGMISDRFGRRPPLIASALIQAGAGIAASYAPSFWMFNVFRFLIGAAVGGCMVTGFVILMEFIGVKHRPIISSVYQVPLNMGHMSLPLISYYLRDFRSYHLAITAPVLVLSIYICLLPETPRWLLAMKRNDEAITILTKVAEINNLPTENIRNDVMAYQAKQNPNAVKKGTMMDLFRTPNLRKHTIAMAFQWFTCSYCFYGVAQYISHLTGNIFMNVAISSSLVTLGTFISIPLIHVMGRKSMLLVFQGLTSICFFILSVMPPGIGSVVFATIGVVAAFIVFILVYLYCSELFPTVVRSAAIGVSSMTARIGSMIAPFVIDTKDIADWMPAIIFAIVPAVSVIVGFLLPETKGRELMTTLEEGENFGKKHKVKIEGA